MLDRLADWPVLLLILVVVILVFGAKRLPDIARSSGQAMRIFRSETRGMKDDEAKAKAAQSAQALPQSPEAAALEARKAELDARQAELDAERERLGRGDS